MQQQRSKLTVAVSVTLFTLGLYLVSSLLLYIGQAEIPFNQLNIFIKPGAFLFLGFSLAAFYVPIFTIICGYILLFHSQRKNRFVLLNLTLIPFLTLAVLLKVVSGNESPDLLVNTFIFRTMGSFLGGTLFLSLLIFEILLILNYARSTQQRVPAQKRSGRQPTYHLENHSDMGYHKREYILKVNRMQQKQATTTSPQRTARKKPLAIGNTQKPSSKNSTRRPTPPLALQPPGETIEKLQSPTKKKWHEELAGLNNQQTPQSPGMAFFVEDAAGTTPENAIEYEIIVDACEQDHLKIKPEHIVLLQENLAGSNRQVTEDARIIPQTAESRPQHQPQSREKSQSLKKPSQPQNFSRNQQKVTPAGEYEVPVNGILNDYDNGQYWQIDAQTEQAAEVLMNTLKEFKIEAEVTGIRKGPVITMFEILPAPGVKLSKIVNLADNIALRLAAATVRIVAPIPGKHAVGIEVPNRRRAIVSFKELLSAPEFQDRELEIPIIIGKDIAGEAQIIDLVQTPHLLIAGATGSGKSVCVNSIISSILYSRAPQEVKLMLIDPKIVELKFYNDIPHLLTPVITAPKRAFQALQYCLFEMERRYSLLDAVGVRDIKSFNKKVKNRKLTTGPLAYIVIIIDEFADLISTSGKEMEATIARLAAMSRAVGIHLVLATQRPSVEVITGLIKANIPSRIAFMVASKFDSRIIIDAVGAEKLLGKGDMLLSTAWDPVPIRIQGAFLSEEEVESLAEHVKGLGEPDYIDEEIFFDDEDEEGLNGDYALGSDDPMMEKALDIVVAQGKASASYLQRKLKIGYNRAARLVEEMETQGVVGPPNGSKPRELLHVPDRTG